MKRTLAVAIVALSLAATTSLAWASPMAVQPSGARTAQGVSAGLQGGPTPSVGVLVRFKQPSSAGLAAKLLAGIDGSNAAPTNTKRGLYAFRTPQTQTAEQYAIQLMLQSPNVGYAEPDYVRQPMGYVSPTDPDFTDATTWYDGTGYFVNGKHWWLGEMNAEPAWRIGQGTTYSVHGSVDDIKVADIDVGAFLTHPDLNGGTVLAGKDEFTSYSPVTGYGPSDSDVTPDATSDLLFESHGTGTAAAIGAEVNATPL